MAFYAVFPFLMIAARRVGYVSMAMAATALCVSASMAFPQVFAAFPMPSFLPLKLNVFLSGMLVAASLTASGPRRWTMLGAGAALALLQLRGFSLEAAVVHLACYALLAVLADYERFPLSRLIRPIADLLSSRPAWLLGEASYSVYLLHLLLVIPAAAVAVQWSSNPAIRCAVLLLVVVPVVYGLAWPLHIWVEKPGIRLGKALIARQAKSVPAPAE